MIDYNQGGLYPHAGTDIIGLPRFYGWFGVPSADVVNYIAKILSTMSSPDITVTLASPNMRTTVEPAGGSVTLLP